MVLLEIRDITKNFGGLRALKDVELDVQEGTILGLIGPNGAGKSTLFNAITGVYRPDRGRVIFNGEDITGLPPHVIAQKGLRRTFQFGHLWESFTVMASMRMAFRFAPKIGFWGSFLRTPSAQRKEREIDQKVLEILRFVGMEDRIHQRADTLSHGYQKTLSLAIALATNSRLLLLDEPVAALNPERVTVILDLIKKVRENGTTVMVIEHNMKALFSICDRVAVLNFGTKITEGTPEEVRENKDVIEAYLGDRVHAA